ncbi:microtubule-associated protein futsch-like isoform X2 [Euwallacea similis]|uniref:microtubule-associated protein futsch-like isoform X2 n=1 Tax=Euwallacea similis TaxID=1736056 RepID=UPI00344CE479
MFEPSDLLKDPPSYEKGDIVWVKLSAYWWPGEVKLEEDLPSDLAKDFKKPPLLIVKFFEEDTYEYIKQWSHVFPYNCDRKAEFIKKGMAGFRAKLSHMTTFPRDIVTAEEKTNGDPNILSQTEFLPNRKINLDEIFGTPSPKKAAKNKAVSAKKSYSRDNSPLVTHRRFLGNDDYKSYIYIQHVGKDRQPDSEDEEIRKLNEEPEKVLSCESCGFYTKRLGVLLIHNKLHLEGAVYVTPKRKSKKIKEEELAGSDTEVAVESPPKPKQRKKNLSQVKSQAQPVDHFANLLDEWNDTDEETEASVKQIKDHNKRGKKSTHVHESKNDTSDNSSDKSMPEEHNKVNTQEDIKNCFDFDEEEEEDDFLYPASTGRKIPRVIPEKPRASISELLELSDKEEQLSKVDSYKPLDIEDANVATEDDNRNKEILRVSQSLNKPVAVDDNLDNAFKELLEETEVPHLDELAQSLKPEQNFHDARTIKFPDKGSTTLKTPVKGGTSKKRFVTSFEGFKAGFRKVDIGRNEDKKLVKESSNEDNQIQKTLADQSASTEVCEATPEKQAKSSDTNTSQEKIIDTKRTRRKTKKPVTEENFEEPTEVAKEDIEAKAASKSPIDAELEGIKRDLETSPKKHINLKPSEGQTEMSLEQLTRELEGSSSSLNTVPTDREVVTSRIGGDKRGEKEGHVSENVGRRSTRSRKSAATYDLKPKEVAKSSRNSQKVVETLKSSQLEEESTAKEAHELESKSNVELEIAIKSKTTSDSVIFNENVAKQKSRKGRRSKKHEEKTRPELITAESEVVPSILQLTKEPEHDQAVGKSEEFIQDTAEEFRRSHRKRHSEDRPIKSNRKGISDEREISVSTRSHRNLEFPASGDNHSLEQSHQSENLLESDQQNREAKIQTSLRSESVAVTSEEKAEPPKNSEKLNTEKISDKASVEHEGTIAQLSVLGPKSNERRSRRSRRLRSDPKAVEANVTEPEKVVIKDDDCSQTLRPRGFLSKPELVSQKHTEIKSDATVKEISAVNSEGPTIAEPLMKVEAIEVESEPKGNRRSTRQNPEIIADVVSSEIIQDVPQEESMPMEPKRRRGRSQRHHEIEPDNTIIVAESPQTHIRNETLNAELEMAQKREELEQETPASSNTASQNVIISALGNDKDSKDNLKGSDNENTAFPAELLMVPLEEIPLPEMPMENLTLDIPVEDIPLPPMSPITERKKRKKLESKQEDNVPAEASNPQGVSERIDVSITESGESPKFAKESESSSAPQLCESSSETEISSTPFLKTDSDEIHKKPDSKSEITKVALPLETSPRTRRRTRAFKLRDAALENVQMAEEPKIDQHVELSATTIEQEALDDIPIPAPTERSSDELLALSGRRRTRAFNTRNVSAHEGKTNFSSKNIEEFEPMTNLSDIPVPTDIEISQSNQVEIPEGEPEVKRERRLTRGLKASEMAGMLQSARIEPKSDSLAEAALDDIPIPAPIETSQTKRVEGPIKESEVKSDRRRTRAFKTVSPEVAETSIDSKSDILAESRSTEVVLDDIPIPAPIELLETKQFEVSVKASEVKSNRRRTRSLNKSSGDVLLGITESGSDLKSGDLGTEIALDDIPIPAAVEESENLKSGRRQTRAYKTSVVEDLKRTEDKSDILAEATTETKEFTEDLNDAAVEGFLGNQIKNDKEALKSDRRRAKGFNARESGISDVQIREQATKSEELGSLAVLDDIPIPPIIEEAMVAQPKAYNEESSSRRRTRSSKPSELTVEEKQLSDLLKEKELVNPEKVDTMSLENLLIPAATETPNASHIVKGIFPSARRQTRSCTKIDQVAEKASSSTHVTFDVIRTPTSSGSSAGTSTGRRRTRSLKSVPVEGSTAEERNETVPDAQIETVTTKEEGKDSQLEPSIYEGKFEEESTIHERRNIADLLQSESATKFMAENILPPVSFEKTPDEITKLKSVEISTPNIAGCKIVGRSNVRRSERLKSSRWDVPSELDLQHTDFQSANNISSLSESSKSAASVVTDASSESNLTVTGQNSSQTESTETETAKQLESSEKPENEYQTIEVVPGTSEAENRENSEGAHISKEVKDFSAYEQHTESTNAASFTVQPIETSNVEVAQKAPLDALSKASKKEKRGGTRKQTLPSEADSEVVFESEISESIDEISKTTGLDTKAELQSLEMCRQEINKIIFGDIVSSESVEANITEPVSSIEEHADLRQTLKESASVPECEISAAEPPNESESEDLANEMAPRRREEPHKYSKTLENVPLHDEDFVREGKFIQLEPSKENLVPPKKSKRSRLGSSSKIEEDIAENINLEGTSAVTTELKEEGDPFKAIPAKLDEPEIILPLKKSKRVSEVSSQISGENYPEKLGGSDFSFQDDSIMSTSLRSSIEGIINDMDIADSSGNEPSKSSLLEGSSVESGDANASKEGSVPPKKKKVDLPIIDKSEEQGDKAEGKVEAMPQAPKKKIQKLFESSQTTEKVDVPPMSPLAKKKSFLFQQDLDNVEEETPLFSKESNDNTENGVAKKRKSSLESECPSKKEKLDDSPVVSEGLTSTPGAAIVQNNLKNESVESCSKVSKDAKKRVEVPHVTADSESVSADYIAPEQIIDLKPDSIIQPELVPIAVTPTVMSEKDLADTQVEITSDKVINEKKPSGYVEPTAVTAETPSGPEISGTEFTSKAMMKDFDNKALTSQPNIYGLKSELLDILEGNSNSSTTSSGSEQKFKTSFDNYEKKKGTVHGIIDFEDAIPSQIVLTNKATADSVLMESPKLLERLSMAPDTKAKSKSAIDLKSVEQVPKTLVGKIAKPLGGIPKPGQKIVIRTTRAMVTTQSKTVGTKPIILSEQIIRPANTTAAIAKPAAQGVKREYEDIEDVEAAFIIPKLAKPTMAKEEEAVIPVPTEKIGKGRTPKAGGKPKINQQPIIAATAETIAQPASTITAATPASTPPTELQNVPIQTAQDDSVFDINSMPIVLSDDLLTAEILQNMPVVLSGDVMPPAKSVVAAAVKTPVQEKLVAAMPKKGLATAIGAKQIIFKTTQPSTSTPASAIKSTTKLKNVPSIVPTIQNKIIKGGTAFIATGTTADGKPAKYVLVPPSVTPATTQIKSTKQTVFKKQPTLQIKLPAQQAVTTTPAPTAEPAQAVGNKIMIVTNAQGQQTRVVLTPQQQKVFLQAQTGAKAKAVIKNAIPKALLESVGVNTQPGTSGVMPKTTVVSQVAAAQPITAPTGLLMPAVKNVKAPAPPKKTVQRGKPQKTILIKNQLGQTVRKIQGTDDADLDRQVAEQLEAIRASARLQQANKTPEIINYTNRTIPNSTSAANKQAAARKSYSKKVQDVNKTKVPISLEESQKKQDSTIPALAPLSPQSRLSQAPGQLTQSLHKPTVRKVAESASRIPDGATAKQEAKPAPSTSAKIEKQAESKRPDSPLRQVVIQDGLGNLTTVTVGQILAIPSETVDGQPQSYMLVTVDESGNLTPLNNDALMSLDPSLGAGGDLNNVVLQVDQGQGTIAAVRPTSESSGGAESAPQKTKVEERLKPEALKPTSHPPIPPKQTDQPRSKLEVEQQIIVKDGVTPGGDPGGQQLIVTGDPVATQKLLESLSDGSTDLTSILANAEGGSVLVQVDGEQILIRTNPTTQPILSVGADTAEINEMLSTHKPNQDILAAALANTDVFQSTEQSANQSSLVKGGASTQLSPSGLFPMQVGNVLETSLTLSSPIMTPLEVPSTNSKKIRDEADILGQVPKNVDLPITITDPNIAQTVALQPGSGLMELSLPIPETGPVGDINSPTFSFSLSGMEDSVSQKPFNGSMPLLTEDLMESQSKSSTSSSFSPNFGTLPLLDSVDSSKEGVKTSTFSDVTSLPMLSDEGVEDSGSSMGSAKLPRSSPKPIEREIIDEGLSTLGGEMCSSLSEPPPDMFDLSALAPKEEEVSSDVSSIPEQETLSTNSENSSEIPLQPPIVASLSDLKRPGDDDSEGSDEKRPRFD